MQSSSYWQKPAYDWEQIRNLQDIKFTKTSFGSSFKDFVKLRNENNN